MYASLYGTNYAIIESGGIYQAAVSQGQYYRLLTAMFLHFDFKHILMNMVALVSLGIALADEFSGRRFLKIYFISGIVSSLGVYLLAGPNTLTAGASGAIYGIQGYIISSVLLGKSYRIGYINKDNVTKLLILAVAWNFMPGISVIGHLSGMVAGSLLAGLDGLIDSTNTNRKVGR